MTQGNPKIIVRVQPELLAEIAKAIDNRNRRTRDEPWDLSRFVRVAIRDKLQHMERSRRSARSGKLSKREGE